MRGTSQWLIELDTDRIRAILDKLITTEPPFPALSPPLYHPSLLPVIASFSPTFPE